MLTRCLQSDDDRIAMMAAQAILDRGYGRPTQSIDAISGRITVRYIAEMPEKCCNDGGMAGKHQAGGRRASAGHRVLLLLSMTSQRIRRSQSPPWGEAKSLMMNQYLIGLGSLP